MFALTNLLLTVKTNKLWLQQNQCGDYKLFSLGIILYSPCHAVDAKMPALFFFYIELS